MRWCPTKRHTSSIKRYNIPNKPTQSIINNIINGDYYVVFILYSSKVSFGVLITFVLFVITFSRKDVDNFLYDSPYNCLNFKMYD